MTAVRKSKAKSKSPRVSAAAQDHPLGNLLLGRPKADLRFSKDASPPWMLINADVRTALAQLAPESVDCIVTSPPYFWQRDYGFEGQIGHERTIEGYVSALRDCFRELRRVLKPDGTFFLNIGDTYYSAKGKPHGKDDKHRGRMLARHTLRAVDGPGLGLPRKSLIGIPWRVALAMQEVGWTLRSDIIWRRPGSMPEPTAKDRPWTTLEHVFLFSTSPRYFFDRAALDGEEDIWHIIARPDNPGSHFAPFPSALAERCVRCGCKPGGVVLDPFAGSGTTLVAARAFGHAAIGIEMSKGYCDFMETRLEQAPVRRATANGASANPPHDLPSNATLCFPHEPREAPKALT